MQPPLNVEKLINFAEVGEFTLPEQLTQAYGVSACPRHGG
jgi:hypothetical protein